MHIAGKIFFTLLVLAVLIFGLIKIQPYLKPNNTAFAPETPSQATSPRLKGIFQGLGSSFSN